MKLESNRCDNEGLLNDEHFNFPQYFENITGNSRTGSLSFSYIPGVRARNMIQFSEIHATFINASLRQ
jgi:hypothetical protein